LVSVKPLVILWPSKPLPMTQRTFIVPTSILLVTHLARTYGWTTWMMNPLRLSRPSAVLPPLHLMGSILWP
jgi:hypothetical protein